MPGTCVGMVRKCFPDQMHTPQPLLVGTCPLLPLQRLGLKAAPVQTWSCCCPLVVEWDTTPTRDRLSACHPHLLAVSYGAQSGLFWEPSFTLRT